MMTSHDHEEDTTMDDVVIYVPINYTTLDNKKEYYQSHMIEVQV